MKGYIHKRKVIKKDHKYLIFLNFLNKKFSKLFWGIIKITKHIFLARKYICMYLCNFNAVIKLLTGVTYLNFYETKKSYV